MDFFKEFNRIMDTTTNLALATCVNDVPNVRILNFYYNTQNEGVVYFASFKGSTKTLEFLKNNKVAFTTIPVGTSEHVRISNGTVQKSNLTIYDLKDEFIKKLPSYEMTISQAGDMLDVYEVHFEEASVILGIGKQSNIALHCN